jgi:hypothetical protein
MRGLKMADPTSNRIDVSGDLLDDSKVIQKPEMPKLYINGFSVGSSLSDIFVIAQTAGTPVALLLMSFTTAKTLAQQLNHLIIEFERVTGQTLLTMDDIKRAVSESGAEVKI